ncbi:4-oxalocrotonate tautomerase [Colwellia chukchiensis]|uniref:4-oxalocrotonate tautomerase n=1 Tax=Colwellia chukchiensis TaxID=641665 RepID=A0A1H7N4F5_9GAMM|nr:tautomerase family protein [Colwellia chukchiensis]SEL17835.1 4-oxalocrotonate tautomerase [Colwellia chukchiensis]
MPLITVSIIENVFSAKEKENIIAKLTDAMVEIEGEGMRPVTWVKIEEVPEGQWGIAGTSITTAMAQAMRKA